MSNVEILGRSNLQTIKSRRVEWNKLLEKENNSKKLENKIQKQDLVDERDEFSFTEVL